MCFNHLTLEYVIHKSVLRLLPEDSITQGVFSFLLNCLIFSIDLA